MFLSGKTRLSNNRQFANAWRTRLIIRTIPLRNRLNTHDAYQRIAPPQHHVLAGIFRFMPIPMPIPSRWRTQTSQIRTSVIHKTASRLTRHMRMILFQLIIVATAFFSASHSLAQETEKLELPECDIFLFEIEQPDQSRAGGDEFLIRNARNVTNRPGYDNQPWFTPNSKSFLYVANQKPDRTDIYEFDVATNKTKQVTDSIEQEYSPQISPDNQTVSFVTDGKDANQSVWMMKRNVNPDANQTEKQTSDARPKWLLSKLGEREPVGYYSWNHRTDHVLFWSRYGYSMRLANRKTGKSWYISGHAPPSSPYIIPMTDNFSFVHRQANGEVWIKELNPKNRAVRPLIQLPGSNSNYGWTPNGRILNIDGDTLKQSSNDFSEWKDVADLSKHGIQSATRVAVSPNGKLLTIVGIAKRAN